MNRERNEMRVLGVRSGFFGAFKALLALGFRVRMEDVMSGWHGTII